jgi:hypothetical protein
MTRKTVFILAFVLMVAVSASAQQVRVNSHRTPLRADPATSSGRPTTPQTTAKKPTPSKNRWTDLAYLALGGTYQSGVPAFSEAFSFTEYVEQATITTDYPAQKGPAVDVGGAVRLWRNLALGVSVSLANRSTDGTVNGAIPHPFYFNAGRAISGSAALKRTESALHLHALWVIPAGPRILIAAGGGPSFISVKQSLVQSVSYSESYPYDTATFASASVSQPSASAVGFGGSVEFGYYFTRTIGLGAVVRYYRATVSFPSHDATLSVDAGGFEGGLGFRFRIPQGKPKKVPAKQPLPVKPVKK